jgi:hypothetical protein
LTKTTAAVVVFLALLAVVAGLYAAGPKYKVHCDPGHTLKHVTGTLKSVEYCQSKYGSEFRPSRVRRTSAWERVWYAVVGSKNTRG